MFLLFGKYSLHKMATLTVVTINMAEIVLWLSYR